MELQTSAGGLETSYYIIPMMRRVAALAFVGAVMAACGPGLLFQRYEYEEDVYLSLDGTATVYVNASLAALNTLRGTSFDTAASAFVDREKVQAFFSGPGARGVAVTSSRRSGRRFVHVRVDVDDIRKLGQAAPFAWSNYEFERDGERYDFRQAIGGASADHPVGDVVWGGREMVAFRWHLPSKILDHNALPTNFRRGNILVWEQSLAERRRGVPLAFEARMQAQSILNRTLWLFGATFAAVAILFGLVIGFVLRRGSRVPVEVRSAGAGM
jgi:hypothetical protein